MELWLIIVLAVLAAAVVILFAIVLAQAARLRKLAQGETANKVKIKNHTRYSTTDHVTDATGAMVVTHLPKDIYLQAGETYTVAAKGKIEPGQYTVLSTATDQPSFTIRLDGVVKTYHHNDTLVLGAGSKISPRSQNIILR